MGEKSLLNTVVNLKRLSFGEHVGYLVKARKVLLNAVLINSSGEGDRVAKVRKGWSRIRKIILLVSESWQKEGWWSLLTTDGVVKEGQEVEKRSTSLRPGEANLKTSPRMHQIKKFDSNFRQSATMVHHCQYGSCNGDARRPDQIKTSNAVKRWLFPEPKKDGRMCTELIKACNRDHAGLK